MFGGRLIFTPFSSEAISYVEWNSETQELFVNYTSSDKITYFVTDVDFASAMHLLKLGEELDSLGKALYIWKKERAERKEKQVVNELQDLLDGASPQMKKIIAQWLRSHANDGLTDNKTKRIRRMLG